MGTGLKGAFNNAYESQLSYFKTLSLTYYHIVYNCDDKIPWITFQFSCRGQPQRSSINAEAGQSISVIMGFVFFLYLVVAAFHFLTFSIFIFLD